MPALKEAPNLKPCPFCGNDLEVKWDRPNPSARCVTDGCIAQTMSILSLDVPGVIDAWNTRSGESPCVEQVAITTDAAKKLGAKGANPTEAERLLFEAWMEGHCWSLHDFNWDGQSYRHEDEVDGNCHSYGMHIRALWAAWRDSAALRNFDEVSKGLK